MQYGTQLVPLGGACGHFNGQGIMLNNSPYMYQSPNEVSATLNKNQLAAGWTMREKGMSVAGGLFAIWVGYQVYKRVKK